MDGIFQATQWVNPPAFPASGSLMVKTKDAVSAGATAPGEFWRDIFSLTGELDRYSCAGPKAGTRQLHFESPLNDRLGTRKHKGALDRACVIHSRLQNNIISVILILRTPMVNPRFPVWDRGVLPATRIRLTKSADQIQLKVEDEGRGMKFRWDCAGHR